MTQELNLANLLQTLRRRWLLIALVLSVTVGATLLYGLLRPPAYQARAVLRVRVPQFQWNIDPAVQRIIDTRRDWRREFMLLGQTKTVAERAVAGLNLTVNSDLLARVTLRAESTDSILLDASGPTAADAAQLANAWADALQKVVAEQYGTELMYQEITALGEEFKTRMDSSQQALEAFKAETGQGVGSAETFEAGGLEPDQKELDAKAALQADYQVALDAVNRLLTQIDEAQAGQRAPTAIAWEMLANDILQARAALQDAPPAFSDLAAWKTWLQAEAQTLQESVTWFGSAVLKLQAKLATEDSQIYWLTQQRNLAADPYLAVRRQLHEIEYQTPIDPLSVEILEQASAETASRSWSLLLRLVIAAVAGLIAGVWLALLWEFVFTRRPQAIGVSAAS